MNIFKKKVFGIFGKLNVEQYQENANERSISFLLTNHEELSFDKLAELSTSLGSRKINVGHTTEVLEHTFDDCPRAAIPIFCWEIHFPPEQQFPKSH